MVFLLPVLGACFSSSVDSVFLKATTALTADQPALALGGPGLGEPIGDFAGDGVSLAPAGKWLFLRATEFWYQ